MPRLTHITFALATLFATAAILPAQNAYSAGHSNTNEALQYQNQNGQKASPYDYDGGNTQAGTSTYTAPQAGQYSDNSQYAQTAPAYPQNQYAQQAPAYNDGYAQTAPVAPAVDSGIEYPAPAVVAAPYPYPYYGYPYGYYPYYGGVHIGLGFGYYGGYRGGYYPRGYIGGYRGGFRGPVGGFHGGVGFRGHR